jgi:hypothetical protein
MKAFLTNEICQPLVRNEPHFKDSVRPFEEVLMLEAPLAHYKEQAMNMYTSI